MGWVTLEETAEGEEEGCHCRDTKPDWLRWCRIEVVPCCENGW